MEHICLSIIVPVYNVEEYLHECVTSIVTDNPEHIEVILVDDGSTDRSSEICDVLSSRYSNVHCIHKENGGVSAARNTGISVAKGEYVVFVDADDRIATHGIASVVQWTMNGGKADICFLQGKKLFAEGGEQDLGDCIYSSNIRGNNKETIIAFLSTRPKYPGSACTKVLRKRFLLENNLVFPTDRKYGEDLKFVLECILLADTFDALDMPYYEYRQNRLGSATSCFKEDAFQQLSMFVSEYAEKLTDGKRARNSVASNLMAFIAYEYSILLWKVRYLPVETRKCAYAFLEKYRWVLRFGKTSKVKTIAIVQSLLGVKATSFIVKCYMDVRR